MALLLPLLLTLMFGSFELGHYFYTEHKLVKSVRDAARFAARQPEFYNAPCVPGVVPDTNAPALVVDNVARFGKVIVNPVTDKTVIRGWQDAVVVELDCPAIGSYGGIYSGMATMPMVTVSAVVDYPSLFGSLGFDAVDIDVSAESQAAVVGL